MSRRSLPDPGAARASGRCRRPALPLLASLFASLLASAAPLASGSEAFDRADVRSRSASVTTQPRVAMRDVARIDRLLKLIQSRLAGASADAAVKWSTMARIEDAEGEDKAIAHVRERAAAIGLDADLAANFARAQIEASKSIQAARHREWTLDRSSAPQRKTDRAAAADVAWPRPAGAPPQFGDAELKALHDAIGVLGRPGARAMLDARAADIIQVGGADLLAGQIALKPLYDITR